MPEQVLPSQLDAVHSQAECLYDMQQVNLALDKMALDISTYLADANPVVLCAMVGGVITAGLLLPRLQFKLQLDYFHATRYGNQLEGGALEWLATPRTSLAGREVLIVDDILDRGLTLSQSILYCQNHGASKVYTAVLTDKKCERDPMGVKKADFCGLTVPERFVFGLGLDYHGWFRNWPGIYALPAHINR